MLRTLAVILLLPGCARLAVSLNRAERKGFNEAPKMTALARAQAQLIRRVLRGETHYDVLDLPANSTTDEIKAARDDLTEFLVCSCGFVVLAELLEYVEYKKHRTRPASQDASDGKFGDALADALAFAEDDEQAEGLAHVLEDCIGDE